MYSSLSALIACLAEKFGSMLGYIQVDVLKAKVVCRLQEKVLCFNDDIQVGLSFLIHMSNFWLRVMRLQAVL